MGKQQIVRTRVLPLICVLLIACFSGCVDTSVPSQNKLNLTECAFNIANYKQFASNIQLGVCDEQLYLWNRKKQTFSHYEDGAFRKICKVNGSWLGVVDDAFYYKSEEKQGYSVNCIRLADGEDIAVAKMEHSFYRQDTFFTEDGKLYVPSDGNRTSYKVIAEAEVLEEIQRLESYQIGDYCYMLEGQRENAELVRYDADGNRYSYGTEIPYGEKSMIPCEEGLLIHNETNGDFLYFVEADTGNAVALYTAECIYAYSAVNVYGDNAYLSFVRYTQWGPLGLGGQVSEDDELNGTYRISLKDYSVTKISDEIYNGLFIFDDSGIYACNSDGQICKLDFNGNVLLRVSY